MKLQTTSGDYNLIDMAGWYGMYRGHKFMARQIQKFMRIYKRKNNLPDIQEPICNHAFQLMLRNGELYVAEAIGKGVVIKPFLEAYPRHTWKDVVLYGIPSIKIEGLNQPEIIEFTEHQKELISAFCEGAAGKRYEFSNFLFHAWDILSKRAWKGKKNSRQFNCTELVTTAQEYVFGTFSAKQPWEYNPYDMQITKDYEPARIIGEITE